MHLRIPHLKLRILNGLAIAALLLAALPVSQVAQAAGVISLTTPGSAYAQDFDTLANSGTANTIVPEGWEFTETGGNANTVYRAGTGSDNAGDTYSFGSSGATDRAFGGLRSGNLVPFIGAQFANMTGLPIASLEIAYTGEQWRLGQNTSGRAADRLDFQISFDATGLTNGTWIDYDALDFSSPVTSGTNGAINGNADTNRTSLSYTIADLAIPDGATFWIRWLDTDLIPGADDGLSVDDFSLVLGAGAEEAPSVLSTEPASGAADVPVDSNLSITFSEPVDLAGSWYELSCSTSGLLTGTVSGGPTVYTIDPDANFVGGESCTLTLLAANITDQDANDPPDNMEIDFTAGFTTLDVCALAYTPAYQIQGAGDAAAITGAVTTQGVVVGDYEYPGSGSTSSFLRGFFLQDLSGDGDPATSDGIFVFNASRDNVQVGDVVRVSGTASEYQGQTQISASSLNACGTGSVEPVDVTFPVPSSTYLEQYEGMLVRLPQTMYVTEHYLLGRFGMVLVSADARLQQPTNVTTPGESAQALQAANDLNKIIIDDGTNIQNPDPIVFGRGGQPISASNTLRGGDTAAGIVGVMTYTWAGASASGNAYRVRPVNALGTVLPDFQPANPRPAGAPVVDGTLKVASMNLLNYFNTFDGLPDNVDNCTYGAGGAATDCRGADDQIEFDRQWAKTVTAILSVNPDVLAVNEIENDGYGADSAIQHLVNQLNAATAPGTYAFIDADSATGQVNALGTDAIKVGMLYKTAAVTPLGTAALNTVAFVNGGDGDPRSRPALAQTFEQPNGARVTVVANHLKSKGSACDLPDAGDGQGNCNVVRTNAATELSAWLATDPTGSGDADVLVIGDLNSYAMEDPIGVLKAAGYTNLVETFLGPDAYSYVFDGQWGYLDHALASPSLVAQVSGVGEYHINADEPSVLDFNTNFKSAGQIESLYAPDMYRISDHDPVIVGLTLNAPPTVDAGGPYVITDGVKTSVTFHATGTDPNGDELTYAWDMNDDGIFETTGQNPTIKFPGMAAPAAYPIRVQATDPGGLTAVDETTLIVIYKWSNFLKPVLNFPSTNKATAGSAVPIKFSLYGDKGLDIFAAGYPKSQEISCSALSTPVDGSEETSTAGDTGLLYDASANQYNYVWKTESAWAGTCRQFVIVLADGTVRRANFKFK